jgi:ABC-type xylose transport system permease subunit
MTMKAIRLLQRLREPSTWAGIAAIGMIFGLPPGTIDLVGQIVGGVAGLAAIVLPENRAE